MKSAKDHQTDTGNATNTVCTVPKPVALVNQLSDYLNNEYSSLNLTPFLKACPEGNPSRPGAVQDRVMGWGKRKGDYGNK
jgi:hypothetical protein